MASLDSLNLNKFLQRTDIESSDTTLLPSSLSVSGGSDSYGEIPAESIISGELIGNLIMVDGFIRSKGYVDGSAGWTINADGSAQFSDITLIGGTLKYGKTSFTDSVNAGYILDTNGVYIGSASDATSLKYTLSSGAFAFKGTITITGGSGIASLTDAGALATADTADFDTQVSGTEKPEDNATLGADWSVDLSNIPATLGTPSADGLYLSSTYLGYYKSSAWTSYIRDNGDFYFAGDGSSSIDWNVTTSSTLTVKGKIQTGTGSVVNGTYIDSLSVGKLTTGTITSKTITLAVSAGTGDVYIAAGKTDFTNTQSGFILGIDDSDSDLAKFYIGDANSYLNWNGANLTATNISIVNSFTAAEDITGATVPVPIYINLLGTLAESKDAEFSGYTTDYPTWDNFWSAQTFTVATNKNTITKVKINIQRVGSPSGNLNVSIYATEDTLDGAIPTGSALATKSMTAADVSTSAGLVEFVFASALTVEPNTQYAIVINVPDGENINRIEWNYSSSGSYTGGAFVLSINSGSTWSITSAYDFVFEVYDSYVEGPAPGEIMACDDTNTNKIAYTGFATSTADENESIYVQFSGIVEGFSGLTIGSVYYLDSSESEYISTSAGENSVKLGRAVSSTGILIYQLAI